MSHRQRSRARRACATDNETDGSSQVASDRVGIGDPIDSGTLRNETNAYAHYNRRMLRKPMQRKARASFGFTLIEVMVVIVILGILAALIVPRVLERTDEARVIAAKNDIAAIKEALKLY